jgi:dTDP-4-amino-4,6-dideoxygalactose transaminase
VPGARHVYQSYVVQLPASQASHRGELIASMKASGIETTVGTYHMPLTTFFRRRGQFKTGDFPATDEVASRAVTLPLYDRLIPADQAEVIAALMRSLRS